MVQAVATAAMIVGLSACASAARATEATITVPGRDLVVTGRYDLPVDKTGGFIIDIKLPQPGIEADRCGSGVREFIVEMGGDDAIGRPSAAQVAIREKKTDYYKYLVKASQSKGKVVIKIAGSSTYLQRRKGKIFLPYCAVIFYGFGE